MSQPSPLGTGSQAASFNSEEDDQEGHYYSDTETENTRRALYVRSGSYVSDQATENSDNISTTPLKSMVSAPSTKSPSVLSGDMNHDTTSLDASTAETSIAPSSGSHWTGTHLNPLTINRDSLAASVPTTNEVRDRDSESIVTLASSTRRVRRRSLETNSSTAGIAPASIMERISGQPVTTTNNSAYANSFNDHDHDHDSQQSVTKSN
ncbi:hypothetical protein PSN45_005328 [Yamadazyma tenuis]|uniref:uncharacterized protein n=1 Tax=Candida tenuis TaxID=2315449 RepID=UPI0027A7A609|nr:hypothetical protein PSN45_005328 [Yamadazyma tenuis]